jgi:hypothetical protein
VTRAELTQLAERWLDAQRLPLVVGFRATENGVEPSSAPRRTLTRQVWVAPEEPSQIFISGIADDGQNAVFATRLRMHSGELVEAESLVTHKGESSIFEPKSLFERRPVAPLAPRDRTPRKDMIAAVRAYFDAIESDSPGATVPFHPDCDRIENGAQTTRNPAFLGGLSAREQLDRKVFQYIEKVRGRRHPIADEETGQVLAIVFLDVSGKVTEIEVGGRRVPLPPHVSRPRSTLLFEVFRIERGLIRAIDAFMHNLPYGASSGWE